MSPKLTAQTLLGISQRGPLKSGLQEQVLLFFNSAVVVVGVILGYEQVP